MSIAVSRCTPVCIALSSVKIWAINNDQVAHTVPRLICFEISSGVFIFENLLSKFILKFDWIVWTVLFSNTIYKLFRVTCPGQRSIATCFDSNFMKSSCPEVVIQGEIIQGKMSWRNFMGGNCQGGNILVVAVRKSCARGKLWDLITLGVISQRAIVQEAVALGRMSG